jgi:hypothetical protein
MPSKWYEIKIKKTFSKVAIYQCPMKCEGEKMYAKKRKMSCLQNGFSKSKNQSYCERSQR